MSEPRWPPVPWAYRPNRHDDWGWVRDATGNTVARATARLTEEDADRHRREKSDPWEAQARLIAAAPELYALVDDLLAVWDPEWEPGKSLYKRAVDLLAKARGEQ